MLDRRAQVHRVNLVHNITGGSSQFQAMLQATTQALMARGVQAHQALQQAYGIVNNMIDRQAQMLSYIDNFSILAVLTICMLPLALLVKRPKPGDIQMH